MGDLLAIKEGCAPKRIPAAHKARFAALGWSFRPAPPLVTDAAAPTQDHVDRGSVAPALDPRAGRERDVRRAPVHGKGRR